MSAAIISRPFNAAYVKAILTVSLDTTPEYTLVDNSSAKPGFPRHAHLTVKDHEAFNELPVWCNLLAIFQDLKSNHDILHLFRDGVSP